MEVSGIPRNATWRSALQGPSDIDAVYTRDLDPIYRFIYSRVGNREDAEDLTSEVFLKAARQLDSGRAEASIADWLYTVARTVLADHWRRYYRTGTTLPLEERAEQIPRGRHTDTIRTFRRIGQSSTRSITSALSPRTRTALPSWLFDS